MISENRILWCETLWVTLLNPDFDHKFRDTNLSLISFGATSACSTGVRPDDDDFLLRDELERFNGLTDETSETKMADEFEFDLVDWVASLSTGWSSVFEASLKTSSSSSSVLEADTSSMSSMMGVSASTTELSSSNVSDSSDTLPDTSNRETERLASGHMAS